MWVNENLGCLVNKKKHCAIYFCKHLLSTYKTISKVILNLSSTVRFKRIFCEKVFDENYRQLSMYYNSILCYDPKLMKIDSLQMIVSGPTFFYRLFKEFQVAEKNMFYYIQLQPILVVCSYIHHSKQSFEGAGSMSGNLVEHNTDTLFVQVLSLCML